MIGHLGRYLEIRWADLNSERNIYISPIPGYYDDRKDGLKRRRKRSNLPVVVTTTIAEARQVKDASTAAMAMV